MLLKGQTNSLPITPLGDCCNPPSGKIFTSPGGANPTRGRDTISWRGSLPIFTPSWPEPSCLSGFVFICLYVPSYDANQTTSHEGPPMSYEFFFIKKANGQLYREKQKTGQPCRYNEKKFPSLAGCTSV